ncbi:MAG: alpha/beta hydrolase family protein [Hormoscilla sp.]
MSDYESTCSFYLPSEAEQTPVGVVADIKLTDHRRDREVPVKIYYPDADGTFPVILFSHGTGGSQETFAHLSRFWSSYGYVCIHPTHLGSDTGALKTHGFLDLMEITRTPKVLQDRPQDISYIIDSLDELEQLVPQLTGKMERGAIGVGGHSAGAYTTMLLAGASATMPSGEKVNLRDSRVRSFLAISPQGTTPPGFDKYLWGLDGDSWSKIAAPMMTVSGSKDKGWEGRPPSWKVEAFNNMPRGDKYHLLIQGAGHFAYDNSDALGINNERIKTGANQIALARKKKWLERKKQIHLYLQRTSIAFWDAHLKSKELAKKYLMSDGMKTSSDGAAEIYFK